MDRQPLQHDQILFKRPEELAKLEPGQLTEVSRMTPDFVFRKINICHAAN